MGKSNSPDQPTNTKRSRLSQSSRTSNHPLRGKERAEVQQNFPIKTGETASLFLQHFIKIMKAGGKAGVVIKNTFLSNTDNASVSLRKLLLENCNLHTVLDLPGGTFTGAGVKTVVLFFEKGSATKKVWFYQLNLDRNLGKTNALNEKDLADFVELQKTKKDSISYPFLKELRWDLTSQPVDEGLVSYSDFTGKSSFGLFTCCLNFFPFFQDFTFFTVRK